MNFFKNKLAVTIVVLSVTFLVLIGYTVKRENKSIVENGAGTVINEASGLIYKLNDKIKGSLSFIFNYSNVKKENSNLKKENSDLKNQLVDYELMKDENDRLRKMLNFKNSKDDYKYLGCDIVGKSGNGYMDQFTINKGSNDGIEEKMVVVASDGLVGQVTSLGKNWATVQTISNENIAVSAMVQSTQENSGIIKGFKNDDKCLAMLNYLPLESNIKKGDTILTSGLGKLYPKGIRIGEVLSVEEDKGKVMKNAIIKPFVNFNELQEIFVIISKNKANAGN